MEEKIIIKGTPAETVKIIMIAMLISFSLSALLFFILLVAKYEAILHGYYGAYGYTMTNGYVAAFRGGNTGCLISFIFACCLFLVALYLLIVFLITRKCSITITEKNVKGTAIFGKEVVLPLYMVSAYVTRKLFYTIAIATSSGITKFSMIKNYKEIGNELSRLINERQEKTTVQQNASQPQTNNNLDDLLKLKTLLDNGIITQEEFDAKKKDLLGM